MITTQAGKPVIAWDDPVAKAALVDGLVKDALAIIGGFPRASQLSREAANARSGCWPWWPAKTSNRPTTGPGRVAQKVAPDRVISVVDPEARHMHKSRSDATATATRPNADIGITPLMPRCP